MPIQWTKKRAIGIPDLDAQPLELDALLAHDAICEDRVPDVSAVLHGVRSSSTRRAAHVRETNRLSPGEMGT